MVTTASEQATREKRPNRAQRRREQGKGARVGLSLKEVAKAKRRLRGHDGDGNRLAPYDPNGQPRTFVSSEPWLDAQFPVLTDTKPDGEVVTYQFHDPRQVPVGQVRCRKCGHGNPPQCVGSSGHCDDCRFGAMTGAQLAGLPGSTSSMSIRKIRQARARGEQPTGGM